jgi:hypothetical protein
MELFEDICKEFGVPLAEEKTVGPTAVIEFLGLMITINQQIRIPSDKLDRLSVALLEILGKKGDSEMFAISYWVT